MMVWATDEAGETLAGQLDGRNRVFRTLQPMRTDRRIAVYVNGQLRQADLANGYTLLDAQTVQLNEPPVPQDTVAVQYFCDPPYPAVAGGTPRNLGAQVVAPMPLAAHVADQPAPLQVVGRQNGGGCP